MRPSEVTGSFDRLEGGRDLPTLFLMDVPLEAHRKKHQRQCRTETNKQNKKLKIKIGLIFVVRLVTMEFSPRIRVITPVHINKSIFESLKKRNLSSDKMWSEIFREVLCIQGREQSLRDTAEPGH